MARVQLGVSGSSKTGELMLDPVNADPIAGNSVANNGETILTITNLGDVAHSLAAQLAVTVDGQPVGPRTYTVPAGQSIIAGPYPPWWYGTTLLVDADSSDLLLSALRPGPGLPAPSGPAAAFTLSGGVVVADLSFAGLATAGLVLTVDTVLTSSTVDGAVLVVPV